MICSNLHAYDIAVNNDEGVTIYYNWINDKTELEVTSSGYSNIKYNNSVIVPESVIYNGQTYSVTRIGDGAFKNCSSMTYVYIPNSVMSIGIEAFRYCSSLTSITIPNSVKSIGNEAFYYCSGLTSINIPNNVTNIGNDVFFGCTNLPIENNIRYADTYLVEAVDKTLSSYQIKEGTRFIGPSAFYICLSLTSITIPSSVMSIGNKAFSSCSSLTSINIPDGVTIIGGETFERCSSLTSIIIPDGVTRIGYRAFEYCSGLTSVTIPSSVTNIGSDAFYKCSSLISVHIIDIAAWCKITFEGSSYANPLSYAHHIYLNNKEITDLVIPNGVTSIGDYTFYGCSSFSSIKIPDGVTNIGYESFYNCSGITSVTIPSSVTNIDIAAFSGCKSLISINIPDGVTKINAGTFSGCNSLPSINIPDGVTSIGNSSFSGCSGLISIKIPDGVISIGSHAFFGCNSLKTITIPESISIIEAETFNGCTGIKSITLPNSLKIIREKAFYNCKGLETITIPSTVEFIYQQAFSGCGLKEVKVLGETPPFAYDNTFSNYNIPLYVPEASISSYQSTNPWSKFASLKTLSGGDVEVKKCATPTISYNNGKISFGCETEGVEYSSSITDTDIKNYSTATIDLGVTYTITVYATKSGYQNSDVATATLCWIDVDPRTEGLTTDVAQVNARAVMIQSHDGVLTVSGADDGTDITVYSVSGKMVGHAKAIGNKESLTTNLQKGDIAIVKIGDKSVKVMMQ